jgi:hypothetical protein
MTLFGDEDGFDVAIGRAAEALGDLDPSFVDKDYWVTQVLRVLQTEYPGDFFFKGRACRRATTSSSASPKTSTSSSSRSQAPRSAKEKLTYAPSPERRSPSRPPVGRGPHRPAAAAKLAAAT